MGGAVPPLPQYAFMAWYSVGGSTGIESVWDLHEILLSKITPRYDKGETWKRT